MTTLKMWILVVLIMAGVSTSAAAQHSVVLTWTWTQGSGDPGTSFLIQRSATTGGPYTTICGGTGQPVCPTITTFTYTDLTVKAGDNWFYVVAASGPGGVSGPSNQTSALVPFLPPGVPSGLQSTAH